MNPPVVTLLTDFGTRDTYVGQMKGVVLTQCPTAMLVDLTHELPAQSILTGAIHLAAVWRWFPPETIHIAVVDPGVGTERRALALRIEGHTFLVPDNGIMSAVLSAFSPEAAMELDADKVGASAISTTFHGRDLFALVAGKLAAGGKLEDFGEAIDPESLERITLPEPTIDAGGVVNGEVLLIDRFGNAITNIDGELIRGSREAYQVVCGGFRVIGVESTYAGVRSGAPVALVSSMNTLELAVRDGSAAERYDLRTGMHVALWRTPEITTGDVSLDP